MTVVTRGLPREIWECGQCRNRAELFIRASAKPVCANKHGRRQMVRIWDREVGGDVPPRGEDDGDV